jgi:hypothetical protein
MREYEYRILQLDGSPAIVTMEVQVSPGAAIRSARKMARGRPFEVWWGQECISGVAKPPPINAPDSRAQYYF